MKWASKQPVLGGLPGATLPCLAIHGYIHRKRVNSPCPCTHFCCLCIAIIAMNVNTYMSLR